MSREQLQIFLAAIKSDPILKDKLDGALGPADVVEIARCVGCEISSDVLIMVCSEIADDELEALSGGGPCGPRNQSLVPQCGPIFSW